MLVSGTEAILTQLNRPPRRIVSLVPSLTESLFDLGFGDAVVGITDYCTQPRGAIEHLPRVGGTRSPRMSDIQSLQPDLILANQEENPRPVIETLAASNNLVWLVFPQTVRDVMRLLWALTEIFGSENASIRLRLLEDALQLAELTASETPLRYFCPIWLDEHAGEPWWMTFNAQTYPADLLRILGGQNVFAERSRRYPLEADLGLADAEPPAERDTRYPRLTVAEIIAADPEVILLPDEPFRFSETHRQQCYAQFAGTSAVRHRRIYMINGSLITWHGTRLGRALSELGWLFQPE